MSGERLTADEWDRVAFVLCERIAEMRDYLGDDVPDVRLNAIYSRETAEIRSDIDVSRRAVRWIFENKVTDRKVTR